MAISDKLLYLNGTKQAIKDELNKFGSNITENDTFRSYSNVINDIYDKLPKVSANGSDFSLENAQNGKLDLFEMDGNTEQDTYSGKNLFNIPDGSIVNQGVTVTRNNNVITFSGTATGTYPSTGSFPFTIAPGTYTISSTNNNYDFFLWFRNLNSDLINSVNLHKGTKTITITSNNITALVIGVENLTTGTTYNIETSIQIEKGSTATEYEPYQSQDFEIDLGDIELCKIDTYKDVIFKNNQLSEYYDSTLDEDSWYIKKEIGKVVLDTSNITLRSNYTNIEYAEITKPNDFIGKGNYDDYNVYCSHAVSDIKNAIQYAWDSTYRIGKITNKATTDSLWLGFPKGTGLDNIKTALNGAVVYYVLATPTYEEITNETLISQLESIETFTGLNNFSVSNENNVLPTLYVSRLKELGKLE